MNEEKWDIIERDFEEGSSRLKVNGGYLYRELWVYSDAVSVSLCFVPDVDLQRYQSHLRDAYNQGFKDGLEEKAGG